MDVDEAVKTEYRTLDDLSTLELKMRLALVTSVLREAQQNGDERWRRLIPQQRKLNTALVKRLKEERGERAPVVVGLKPVVLSAQMKG